MKEPVESSLDLEVLLLAAKRVAYTQGSDKENLGEIAEGIFLKVFENESPEGCKFFIGWPRYKRNNPQIMELLKKHQSTLVSYWPTMLEEYVGIHVRVEYGEDCIRRVLMNNKPLNLPRGALYGYLSQQFLKNNKTYQKYA